ncbi:glycosyl transferase family group 2-domain-containing protein [Xylariomycetidae sp. FL2044]|nr:glycosyl transferase family group 2-domain-containing protein [Xylariomycetidae sp. FL2044]
MGFLKSYFVPGKDKNEKEEAVQVVSKVRSNDPGPSGQTATTAPHATPMTLSAPGTVTPRSLNGSKQGSVSALSLYPMGDFRNNPEYLLDIKADVGCSWLYQQQLERQYATGILPGEGVIVKKTKNNYYCCPPQLQHIRNGLYDMGMELNVRCAMTVNTRVINVIIGLNSNAYDYIPLSNDLRLQVLPTMSELPKCQKHHFAAFIQSLQILVVWGDEPKEVLARAALIERQLINMFWNSAKPKAKNKIEEGGEKGKGVEVNVEAVDLEAGKSKIDWRKNKLTNPLCVGLTLILCLTCMALGAKKLAFEVAVDGDYTRLALLVVIPIEIWVAMFFFQIIIVNLFQVFGPISAVDQNSRYYSGKPPKRLNREHDRFPHVTIQMPVYKEGLKAVIMPTVQSIKMCISTYELQGGTANIFINDDGMQLIPAEEAQARREFYEENNIGWVARPKHDPNPEDGARPFQRRGKFKKASNMNYAMMISNRVEEELLAIDRTQGWSQEQESTAYSQALEKILGEDEGRTMAEGNIRIGDYILIIDSDTRVPEDCLLDAVSEMEQSPQVAILQFTSGVMRVTTSYFEGGVTWFTQLIYSAITFVVASGDACPFVGHNAVLRWSAIQDAASYQDEDGYEKFWSESHVSEDFDMSLRLQCAGYDMRFATYTGDGFEEGVSLTVYDELARWEKYAYGCNELMFHPLKDWWRRGPITPLFRKFLSSGLHLPKKITICTYIGTYYAIGACWPLTILNYFVSGWYFGLYDKFYLDSFAIYISVIAVFTGFGNFALAILRYRLNQQSLFRAFWNNLKWIPLMSIFLGGLSLHVSQALLSHFFSIDMTWGATAKELEQVNFVEEVPRLVRRFKGTFAWCFLMTGLIVSGYFFFPHEWQIRWLASIWPLAWLVGCHFLLPVALNPALMVFHF